MKEAEAVSFSVSSGENSQRRRVKTLIYKDVIDFIKDLNLTNSDENKLIACSKKIPSGSYGHFIKNYRKYLK